MFRAGCISFAGLLLLSGCGKARTEAARATPLDAAVSDALADPIMTDPDLTSQNRAHTAIAVSGPVSSALPPIITGDEAVAAATEAAAELVGAEIPPAPAPSRAHLGAFREAVTAAQMAVAASAANAGCAAKVEYTARWAVVLPKSLEVYPRGAVEEAAGTDAGGCALRVVHFETPVATGDVLAFYYARLHRAGFPVKHSADGDDHVLRGRAGPVGYAVYVRPEAGGLTAADIVVGN